MLRATSEMAVAMNVRSVREKPIRSASSRPFWRATTMSASVVIGMTSSSATAVAAPHPGPLVQEREALLEVQGGMYVLEAHAQLDHGERHLGLDPHDDRDRASKVGHVGDRPERAGGERVHHVQSRDVDDDAPGPVPTDLVHQVVL